jgi:hypothetical protein
LRRELYPGLNPTSVKNDLGEDARTEASVLFLHHGLWISVAVSRTHALSKIKSDCNRCKETGRTIDVFVFAASGNPDTGTVEHWRKEIKQEFGWRLEVRAVNWLAPTASSPKHESLVDEYFHIPPPGGDFATAIESEFSKVTERTMRQIRPHLPGLTNPVPRSEISAIEDQLHHGKHVVVTGDAGSGKSGIGANLVLNASDKSVLLLDARDLAHVTSEAGLRHHICINGPVALAVGRIAQLRRCRVVIDQLDNVVGSIASAVLSNLAIDCSHYAGVEVVVIARKRESHEKTLLENLLSSGFVELNSYPLNDNDVTEVLRQMKIAGPTPSLIELGRNFLNLELIGRIKQQDPGFEFANITDEVYLWAQYHQILVERENTTSPFNGGEQMVAEAARLAHIGLTNNDGSFMVDYPLSKQQQRLISWDVITPVDGRSHRFRHEKLQDFMYAWDVTQQVWMPRQVVAEIGIHKSRNVLTWMDFLYASRGSPNHKRFLLEILDVE